MVSQQNTLFPSTLPSIPLPNDEVARRLERGAELLESQAANPYRVNAYRNAAQTIRELSIPLVAVARRLKKSETEGKRKAESGKRREKNGTLGTSGEWGIGECGIGNKISETSETRRGLSETCGTSAAVSDSRQPIADSQTRETDETSIGQRVRISETTETSPKRKAECRKRSEKNGTLGTSGEWGIGECGIGNKMSETGETSIGQRDRKSETGETSTSETALKLLTEKLQTLPGIGESLAATISTLVLTGHWELLEQLEQDASYAAIFSTVPGIGSELADRIHTKLGIETLPELAAAAHDGRLSHVPGFGPKRLRSVRESLSGRLHRSGEGFRKAAANTHHEPLPDEPPVNELLSIDEQYRRQAAQGVLPKVAPRKFNPTRASWLPVLNTQREGRQYTAMYSNTARAHDLGTTKDWVVIHRSDAHGRGLWTVVTSTFGPHKGERVVRGREEEH